MENINTLDNDGLIKLGKQVQDSIKDMMHLHVNGDTFPNMVRNFMCFENRVNNKNEWIQVNLSLTYDPLYFNDDECTLFYWLPPKMGNEITDKYTDGLKDIVKLLIEAQVDGRVIDRILDISEETLTDINRMLYCNRPQDK